MHIHTLSDENITTNDDPATPGTNHRIAPDIRMITDLKKALNASLRTATTQPKIPVETRMMPYFDTSVGIAIKV
jgi:hypothetical protein